MARLSRSERIVLKFLECQAPVEISYMDMSLELCLTERTTFEAVRKLERSRRIQVVRGRGRKPNLYNL